MDAIRVMSDEDYNALISDVDDNFQVGSQTMEIVLDKFQKQKSYMFGKVPPKIVDGVPSASVGSEKPQSSKQKALDAVKNAKTPKELNAALEAAYKYF